MNNSDRIFLVVMWRLFKGEFFMEILNTLTSILLILTLCYSIMRTAAIISTVIAFRKMDYSVKVLLRSKPIGRAFYRCGSLMVLSIFLIILTQQHSMSQDGKSSRDLKPSQSK